MYGTYKVPLQLEYDRLTLSVQSDGKWLYYHRKAEDETEEKQLPKEIDSLLLTPVEPVNTPKAITNYLLIELQRPLILNPQGQSRVYLRFPVEIGVFVGRDQRDFHCIDIFSLSKKKFTLYGDVTHGVICKYYSSDLHPEPPQVDPLIEGIVELTLENTEKEWVEVGRVVFNAYHMKIYYSEDSVTMKAKMTVKDRMLAETEFINKPLFKGMKKSIELHVSRKLPVVSTSFVMEWGL